MNGYDESFFKTSNKEEIVKQISELRKNIKRKHKSIKQNITDTEELWEKQLAPIAEPLKKLVEEGEQQHQSFNERKRKILSDDNETPIKRFVVPSPQGKKRKPNHNLSLNDESNSDYELMMRLVTLMYVKN